MSTVLTDLSLDDAIARLEVSQDPCRLCQEEIDRTGIAGGHVVGRHPTPRRVTHSQLGALGADWDTEHVIEFLKAAERIIEVPEAHWMARTGHRVAALGKYRPDDVEPKWYAFAAVPA